MDMKTLPEVAKSIYYPCTKCDRERYFRVLAHTSETTAKLECEVCGAKRKLDIAKKKKTTKKKTTRKKTTKKAESHLEAYEAYKSKFSGKAPVAYTASGKFSPEMVIDHPMFGIGFVTLCVSHKIEVVFEEGVKSLIHQYTP